MKTREAGQFTDLATGDFSSPFHATPDYDFRSNIHFGENWSRLNFRVFQHYPPKPEAEAALPGGIPRQ